MPATHILEITSGYSFFPPCEDCEKTTFNSFPAALESGFIRRSDVIIVDCDIVDISCIELIDLIREESGRIKIILTGDFIPHLPPDKIPEIFFLAKKPITPFKINTILQHLQCRDCGPVERRKEPRFSIAVDTEISCNNNSIDVQSANLSLHGIQLVFRNDETQCPPEQDQVRNLKIKLGEEHIELPGVIRYSTEGKEDEMFTGLEFKNLSVPSVTKLFAFLASV